MTVYRMLSEAPAGRRRGFPSSLRCFAAIIPGAARAAVGTRTALGGRGAWAAGLLAVGVCLAAPALVRAQENAAAPPGESASEAAPPQVERTEELEAVVRGLFVEGRVGGGYMVYNAKTPNLLEGGEPTSEKFGAGATVQMALGYDITDFLALQLIGGTTLVSGSRQDKPRDLDMFFGGAEARLSLGITQRLDFLFTAGASYVWASNAVEAAQTGVAIMGGLGLEYYVHVRHFSIGLVASGFVPTKPWRAFVGLTPTIKYTF